MFNINFANDWIRTVELWTSGIGSDRYTNWVATTAPSVCLCLYLCFSVCQCVSDQSILTYFALGSINVYSWPPVLLVWRFKQTSKSVDNLNVTQTVKQEVNHTVLLPLSKLVNIFCSHATISLQFRISLSQALYIFSSSSICSSRSICLSLSLTLSVVLALSVLFLTLSIVLALFVFLSLSLFLPLFVFLPLLSI